MSVVVTGVAVPMAVCALMTVSVSAGAVHPPSVAGLAPPLTFGAGCWGCRGCGGGSWGAMSGVALDGTPPASPQIGRMHRFRSHLITLAAASAATVALSAASANAATVAYAGDGALVFTASPGEANRLGVQSTYDDPSKFTFYDSGTGVGDALPAGCTRYSPDDKTAMTCPNPPAIRVILGDGNDSAYISSDVKVPVTFLGGEGDDELTGNAAPQTFDGGPGNDKLLGYKGDDVLVGGDGADQLEGGADNDQLDAGPGDDLVSGDGSEGQFTDVIDGGPGVDRIETDFSDRTYDYQQPALSVTLGGGADDGRPGENDEVRGVEKLIFNIAGTYTGTDADETLEMHQILGSVTLDGRGGADTLIGADGADRIDGGSGADTIDAGFGDDVITPGPGRDSVSADRRGGDCGPYWCKYPYGNDTVNAADGEVDSIDCGAGTDAVVADPADVVAPNCETVERTAAAQGGGPATANGAGGPAAGGVTLTAKMVTPAAAVRKGLTVKLAGLPAKQRVSLTAKVGKRTVAKGSARASGSGGATVVLRFTKAGKQALRGKKRVTLVISGAGAPATVQLRP